MDSNEYLKNLTERYDGDDVIKYSLISIAFTVLVFFMYFFKGFYYRLPEDTYCKYFMPVNMTMRKVYIAYLCCYTLLSLFLIYKAFNEVVYKKYDLLLAFSFIIPSVFICAEVIYTINTTVLRNSLTILLTLFITIYIITAIISAFHIKHNIKLNRIPKTYSKKDSIITYCCIFGLFLLSAAFGEKIPPKNPMYKQSLYAIILLLFIDYVIVVFLYKYYLKRVVSH